MNKEPSTVPCGEIILYHSEDGQTCILCRLFQNSLWLNQSLIAELFQVAIPTVNEHLKGIYGDGELSQEATIRKFRIVRQEGTRAVAREIEHYNLEAILAVGYGLIPEKPASQPSSMPVTKP
ncbi:MAG: virulence RhuM family protein [Planctomycetes bacterium]|nr:virulence RhuM family protein [Planctomycetota bacterium]